MARTTTTYAESRDELRRLIPPLLANEAEIPHLTALRQELEEVLAELDPLLAQQASLAAAKQEVSKQLQARLAKARQLGAFLRAGVRQKYGTRSEKLREFNLQPFRGRKAAKPEEPEEPTEV